MPPTAPRPPGLPAGAAARPDKRVSPARRAGPAAQEEGRGRAGPGPVPMPGPSPGLTGPREGRWRRDPLLLGPRLRLPGEAAPSPPPLPARPSSVGRCRGRLQRNTCEHLGSNGNSSNECDRLQLV
ncbi:anthrax toxin receptor-like [Falco cherrug]|uniref:anthrax toxin receptor-like n=1 Tax=Falco cherrug TaxID=345164 RepID=UPI0024794A9A|nr:anthrax toxin receptor-like [Falco cherrug]XP_055647247.1 anthrax toxin receptor-like [Falco peregrinus]